MQASLGDVLKVQDEIAQRVRRVARDPALRVRESEVDIRPQDAVRRRARTSCSPSPTSYLARPSDMLPTARDLYRQSIDERDPRFAPAWARLGRVYRVMSKFIDGAPDSGSKAEDAFRRALALNPRLSIAHKFYANLEAEIGQGERAIVRLIGEATRHGNDPELFSGLVHACRYCGLFEQSIAAHAEARRLDPNISTGVEQTFLLAGELERLLATEPPVAGSGGDEGIRVIGLGLAGRRRRSARTACWPCATPRAFRPSSCGRIT